MLELYHHGSSACAARVRLALDEKQLPWQGHYVDILAGEQFTPAFTRLNPKAVVPVLIHAHEIICESTVICEYLEEVFPAQPLLPAQPAARAAVRIWTKAVDEELHPACSALTYLASHRHTIRRNGITDFAHFASLAPGESPLARKRKWQWIDEGFAAPGAAEQLQLYVAYLRKMDAVLTGSEWLAGASFSLADTALTPYVFRLEILGLERLWAAAGLAGVAHWYARVRERPAFKSALEAWLPAPLAAEMRANGERSWPEIARLLGL